jgi:hypothetical protein
MRVMPDYSKPGQQRFAFEGMRTVSAPDAMPPGKFPLAINVHAYLDDAITPRLPQSAPFFTLVPSAAVHSLRRMNDNTAVLTPVAIGPNPATIGIDSPVAGGTPWSNPGNITGEDGSYASVTIASPGTPGNTPQTSPGTVTSIGGGSIWQNPNNAKVQDGIYTISLLIPLGISQSLVSTGYGFAIPLNAHINGIVVRAVVRGAQVPAIYDLNVNLTKNGSAISSANRAHGAVWSFTPNTQTYGSPTDLWGGTWSPSDINNPNFGVMIQLRNSDTFSSRFAQIDYVSIQVYYTVFSNTLSDLLEGTGFGFALAGGAQIAGIRVDIKGFQTDGGNITVQALKAGIPVGVAKVGVLPSTNGFVSFGASGDLWGTTWLPADVNAANFGFSIQALIAGTGTFNVDYMRVTVYSYTGSPVSGFVLISGASDKLYVNATQVDSGYSQNRLSMVPFRPNDSVRPWMYIGDSAKMSKVSSDGTLYKQGIKEPQTIPGTALAGAGPLTGAYSYAYKYRSSATGAVSNPSPVSVNLPITTAANSVLVTCASSTDPQADLIDIYRFGVGLLSYTYIATISNSAPTYTDNLTDVEVENNQVMTFDDFEPFPSIDTPKVGTLTVSAGPLPNTITCTWVSGDKFNVRWLGGTIVTLGTGSGSTVVTLLARPNSTTVFVGVPEPLGSTIAPGTYSYSIPNPNLAAQPLAALWGPTDNAAYNFACQDPLRPGTLYFTKGNNPDSAPQTNQIEMTSPSEPLIGGAIVGGLSIVFSTERAWLIYPNFAQATATVVGVVGSPFTTVESISERGLWAKEGICTDGGGALFFIAKDGIRMSQGGAGSQSITDDIDNLFPHEGLEQKDYTIAGYTISPPDYSNDNGMALRFSQGYVYFDYVGLDGQYHTLKYHVRKQAWSVDSYPAVASVHADNEGKGTTGAPAFPAIGPLTGCADSTVRNLSTSAPDESGPQLVLLTPSVGGVTRPIKHFGDFYIESSFPAGKAPQFTLTLWTNRYANANPGILQPSPLPIPGTIREGVIVEVNSGQGIFAQDVGLSITGPVVSPDLASDSNGTVYAALYLWEPTLIEQPETIGQRVTDWDDAGFEGSKFVQGLIVEADSSNLPKLFQVQSGDDLTLHDLAEMAAIPGIAFANQSKVALSLAQPFIAHNMRIVPTDNVPWRLFGVKWIFVPIPEECLEWHTEGTGHGVRGWKHIKEVNIEHISTADLTLTLVSDVGAQVSITIPNSGGQQVKTLLAIPSQWVNSTNPLLPASPKFQLVSYNFTSTAPFRLWKEDVEVQVGLWGRGDSYITSKPFGGQSDSQDAEV